ncbi:MAG: hypothetical protein IPJ04_02380 [Candidatus Eisenbacteria bacterium]|nr:hypothetical protein [Candidatus Eisenbacteria bacterium]
MRKDAPHTSRRIEGSWKTCDASPSSRRWIEPIEECVGAGQYYQALKHGKQLLSFEKELLSNVR